MATPATPSPALRFFLGLLCIAGGAIPVLASLDLGPLDADAIDGPRWLGFLAGAVFVAAGIALMVGKRLQDSVLGAALFALIIGSFACIGSWVAFGPGPRECSIAIAGLLLEADWASESACRAGFGIGAILLDGIVLWMIARSLRTIIGPGALAKGIEKLGVALMLLALLPIIVPMLLGMIGKVFIESFITWRATGRWPRNEGFIQRMKARRGAKQSE